MTTVLLTGFEPFGGESVNPSWEAVSRFAARPPMPGVEVHTALLPCVYGASVTALRTAVVEHRPDVVIGFGQAGGRFGVTPELIAVNLDDAPISDNAGNAPLDAAIAADGPLAYRSGLPVKAIVAALHDAGIPASVSHTAGTYICNHVFYAAMHLVATEEPRVRAGFVHVPFATEQVVDKPTAPSLSMDALTEAVGIVLATTVATGADLAVTAGAVS